MSIKIPVVNSLYDIPASNVYTTVEGSVKHVGAIYTSVEGVVKKIWPDANPVSDPTITYNTAGTHTVTLGPGYYKFTISGAGGGAACSWKTGANMGGTVAGGGSGAYGTFELMLNVQETFTFNLGAGGSGVNGGGTQYATGGGTTTVSSNIRGTFLTLNGGGAANGWWEDDRSGHHWQNAGAGGTYSTTLASGYSFNNGSAGTAEAATSYARDYWGYGGDNPSGYQGDGGTAHFYKSSGLSNLYANNGQSGYVKIEPAVQYIYTSPITTSITLDPGTYYFEIVGAGGGGLCATQGGSYYAYANGGSAASGYGYFTVDTQGVYNIQVGTRGSGVTSIADQFSTRTVVSGNGTETYIKRASDNFNVVTCGGGTGASWWCIYHSQSAPEAGFNYGGQGGTYSTSLSGNYTLANGSNGTTRNIRSSDSQVDLPYTYPTYFNSFGQGGASKRLYDGSDHGTGYNGISGMLKIYKYS